MREALYSSIREVWDRCVKHLSILLPDVTVEIYEDRERQIRWSICHESLYDNYLESLLPVSSLSKVGQADPAIYNTVDYANLVQISHLGGQGRTALVHTSIDSDALYVFKGLDFGAFLESRSDFKHLKNSCYHEITTISSLPRHPNIICPPSTFVTVRTIADDEKIYVCGTLYPFMANGTLDDQVGNAQATGTRLPLISKAMWCFQMASAIAHTHYAAHTFHMDIKPANCLLNDNIDLTVIDWEQSGAALYTLAPEVDGSWDVREMKTDVSSQVVPDSTEPKLVYDKYEGPPRENLSWSRPTWNDFPIWRDQCPMALAAAEVFSLGQTMWMLLEQVAQSEVENLDEVVVSWSDAAIDIPEEWRAVVCCCLHLDPNNRIGLLKLVDFWESIVRRYDKTVPSRI